MAYAIIANVSLPDSCLRLGARVVIQSIPGDPSRVCVRGLTRGGRRVTKYMRARGLSCIRVAWESAPPPACAFASKKDAEACLRTRFGVTAP